MWIFAGVPWRGDLKRLGWSEPAITGWTCIHIYVATSAKLLVTSSKNLNFTRTPCRVQRTPVPIPIWIPYDIFYIMQTRPSLSQWLLPQPHREAPYRVLLTHIDRWAPRNYHDCRFACIIVEYAGNIQIFTPLTQYMRLIAGSIEKLKRRHRFSLQMTERTGIQYIGHRYHLYDIGLHRGP